MARFGKDGMTGTDLDGFDSERSVQVVQVGKKVSVYLLYGDDLKVELKSDPGTQGDSLVELAEIDAEKLTKKEEQSNVRKFVLTGKLPGMTQLTAPPATVPLRIEVTKDAYNRVFDGSGDPILDPKLIATMKARGLRGAALRVAEDQLNSKMGRQGEGAGKYGLGKGEDGNFYDWCGGFAQWCYQTAAKVIGATNPFGNSAWALASPQRAISWAMAHPNDATVIRYEGANTFAAGGAGGMYGAKGVRSEKQEYIDVSYDDSKLPANVIEGDICLVRNDAGGWKHVSIVYSASAGGTFDTIDGNQGHPSIKIKTGHKFSDKVGGGKFPRITFLHLSLPPIDWVAGWMAKESG